MNHPYRRTFTATLPRSNPDAARGGGAGGPVLEVATFRLKPGVAEPAFLAAASATQDLVAAQPGFVSRQILRDQDGLWTDMINWQNLDLAMKAASIVIHDPAFAPFGSAIDGPSVTMRHLAVLWSAGS